MLVNTFKYALIILLFYTGLCPAQDGSQIRFQVLDVQSGIPIVYATVILKQSKVGVISDDNGNFRIPGIYKFQRDSLIISCIGYHKALVALSDQKENKINLIYLSVKVESLDEVHLLMDKNEKKLSAGRIVKKAIKHIPVNYPFKPFSYMGYYRDYQKVSDSTYLASMNIENNDAYINLNEGVMQVYDAGFGTNRLTNGLNQTVLYEFQSNENFAIDTLLAIPYDNKNQKYLDGVVIPPLGGNELNLLHLCDALRNFDGLSFSFAQVFSKHFIDNHIFKLNKLLYLDDEPIYNISFISDDRIIYSGYNVKGSILISKQDFGIYNLDYKLFDDNHELLYRVNCAYKKVGDRYYLNYITFNNHFEVKSGDYFKIKQIVYNFENSSFQVIFNESVDSESIRSSKKQFKFLYKDEEIQIMDIELLSPKLINIKINSSVQINKAIFDHEITYEIRKLKDVKGRILDKQNTIRADQFREFFVQKVFPESSIDTSYEFVDKQLPLKSSKKNSFNGKETYWINTPLKASK